MEKFNRSQFIVIGAIIEKPGVSAAGIEAWTGERLSAVRPALARLLYLRYVTRAKRPLPGERNVPWVYTVTERGTRAFLSAPVPVPLAPGLL